MYKSLVHRRLKHRRTAILTVNITKNNRTETFSKILDDHIRGFIRMYFITALSLKTGRKTELFFLLFYTFAEFKTNLK